MVVWGLGDGHGKGIRSIRYVVFLEGSDEVTDCEEWGEALCGPGVSCLGIF